jgi:DNA-binding transcriptional LysR family regulator
MELTDIDYFLAAASHRTLSEAARAVHVSQPAMSAALKRMEASLGTRLLVRSRGRGRVRLTRDGERALRAARRIMREVVRLREDLAARKRLERGHLTVAAGGVALEYFLPRPISRLIHRYPGLRVTLQEAATSGAVRQQVLEGDADIGVVTAPTEEDELVVTRWFEDRLLLVGDPTIVGQSLRPRPAAEVLTDHRLITYGGESDLQDQIDAAFEQVGVERRRDRLVIRSGEVLKRYVEAGLGVGMLTRTAARASLEQGRLVEIPLADVSVRRGWELVHLDDANPAIQAFLRLALAFRDEANRD